MERLSPCRNSVWFVKEFQRKATTTKQLPFKQEKNDVQISFADEDAANISVIHNDPLLLEITINNWEDSKVLKNTCSSVDLIFKEVSELSAALTVLMRKCWAQSA